VNAVYAFDVTGAPERTPVAFVRISKGFGQGMMIRAQKAQIFRTIVPRVAINVIHMQWDAPGQRVPFAPSADAASVLSRLQ
jgi:hypothetical protein